MLTVPETDTLDLNLLRHHPVCRGEFLALVFSGEKQILAMLAGEATLLTKRKFALGDPRRSPNEDFAHQAPAGLPQWPPDLLEPIPGVCFVFDDQHHPAIEPLTARGASRGEHFVVAEDLLSELAAEPLRERLRDFSHALASRGPIILLGYGHQGRRIANILIVDFKFSRDRIAIIDDSESSRRQARRDGLSVVAPGDAAEAAAIIHTPLHHHARLQKVAAAARARRAPVFENRAKGRATHFFHRCGDLYLDASARRGVRWQGMHIGPGLHGLPHCVTVVRDDVRRFGDVTFPHLHTEPPSTMLPDAAPRDLQRRSPFDTFDDDSFVAPRSIYVSAMEGPAPVIAAARSFLRDEWPDATDEVLPSAHPLDMGATSLERLLLRCIGRYEVAMASQTPAQQAALGVIARAYAPDAPIVEIGSALGGSAMLMAAATEEHRPPVISIDPDTASRDVMRFVFDREGQLDRLDQRIATSDDAAAGLHGLRGRAGLVFIDGLHTEEAARRDLENYAPLLRRGGALLFHDAEPAWAGVLQVVTVDAMGSGRLRLRAMIDSLAVFERIDA